MLPSITASGNGQVEYLVVILHLSVSFEDTNEDYLMVADTIGVNRSTARSIVARYSIREGRIAERPRGGANNVRVDNEIKDCLNDILNNNCMLTLAKA